MSRVGGFLLVASLALGAHGADAQTLEPPRFTVGAGAGLSNPLHGDFDFVAPSWDIAVRGSASEYLTVELFVSQWHHTETSERRDVAVGNPSAGIIGRIGLVTETKDHEQRSAGVNFLPTLSRGRLTIAGGAGVGLMVFHHRSRQTESICAGAYTCHSLSSSQAATSLSAQLAAALDVVVAPRLTAFVQSRMLVPAENPAAGQTAVVAGVRITVR